MVVGFLSAGFSSSKFTPGLSYLAFADALRPSNDRALEGDLIVLDRLVDGDDGCLKVLSSRLRSFGNSMSDHGIDPISPKRPLTKFARMRNTSNCHEVRQRQN
jgi:hypothetical protein